MKKIIFVSIYCWISTVSMAQQTDKTYAKVDEFVNTLGALESLNVATIADTLTRSLPDNEMKARAIFYWIAQHIALDAKAIRANDSKKTDPVLVIQSRKATPLGFALLVQEMCSMAKIRCLVVDGYVKNNANDIQNKPDELNHSWNVVQLGQSPEAWYYVDAAKASGYTDVKGTLFTKRFTSGYFFADKKLFNLDHYADNNAWNLGEGPKSVKEFYALPVIGNAAYYIGLQKPLPLNGYIKTKTTAANKFSFVYNDTKPIQAMTLIIGEGNKQSKPEPVNFTDNGGMISFTHTFKKDDTYPVKILADGQEILTYFLDVTE